MRKILTSLLAACLTGMVFSTEAKEICLNGIWEYGAGRIYSAKGQVPGIHYPTNAPATDTIWYRRLVSLPEGDWTDAILELKGARFRPEVYVDGKLVSSQEGGMIRSFHTLYSPSIKPGEDICIEIALCSLKDVPEEDASWIPKVDQWRSSCASCLWDDVVLHLYNRGHVDRVLTWYDRTSRKARLQYRITGEGNFTSQIRISDNRSDIITITGQAKVGENTLELDCSQLEEWSPAAPNIYKVSIELSLENGSQADSYCQNFALRDFHIDDKQFILNGNPIHLRGGTVVWHRWMRDPEGLELGWDSKWIEENMVLRLKNHGANYFRFHLGVPPERILDLCDKYGLVVQYEWNFFHGMPASYESLMEQFPKWFDMASRHPSVLLYHPYNETEGDEQLKTTWKALDEITKEYPPIVLEERDVIHVHKYWWSLFENLGLYYDSFNQFPKAIMVDEFGGNYLDGKADMGLYPSIRESFMRFLGPTHNAQQRLHHLDRSCAKVAEYWRRIGAAGIAPFTIASSQEDGCNWFIGNLRDGKPKNVWNALAVLWSERAVSLDIWDCNFTPGQKLSIPLHIFNDSSEEARLEYNVSVLHENDIISSESYSHYSEAFSHDIEKIVITLPEDVGNYTLRAELTNPTEDVKSAVISDWDIRVLKSVIPEHVKDTRIYIPKYETELIEFAADNNLNTVRNKSKADVIILGRTSFERISKISSDIAEAVEKGTSIIMLDVGELELGQGYPHDKTNLGPLQGVTKVKDAKTTSYPLFLGMNLNCKEMAEPESHIHPFQENTTLWNGIPRNATDLWNGLRGGLIVPASDIEIEGLNSDAFLNQWKSRGADIELIKSSDGYYAYELCGFYDFSNNIKDKLLEKKLREKIQLLIDDAPSLAMSLNAKAPLRITDLRSGYKHSHSGKALNLLPLCTAGKNLTRTPAIMIEFGEKKGKVIISQLITEGRLSNKLDTIDYNENFYSKRYDEASVQMVLNMIDLVRH